MSIAVDEIVEIGVQKIRERIAAIDNEIVQLYVEDESTEDGVEDYGKRFSALISRRNEWARCIGMWKFRYKLPICNHGLEREKIRRLSEEHGVDEDALWEFYRPIFALSKQIQKEVQLEYVTA